MKIVSLPRLKSPFRLSFFLLLPLVFSLSAGLQIANAQQSQLSLVDIIAVLRSKKVTIEERNKLLTEGVRSRGITFAINADLEKELRTAGADNDLIEAIRQKSPVVKVTSSQPPKTDPVAAATPKPPDFSFYQNRANSKFVLGEYSEAIADYNKAIELNSKEPTVYFSRALAYFNLKNFNLAITDYDKAIELDPQESTAYFNRGSALEKIGSFEKALLDYQKAVELDASNEPAKNSLQRLQADLARLKPPATTTASNAAANNAPTVETKKETPVDPSQPFNIGSLKSYAVKLAMPTYPAIERQRNVEGLVVVEVVLNEEGEVIAAKATSGPKSLRIHSEEAARRSRFNPVTVDNKAVKAVGFINYNFKARP